MYIRKQPSGNKQVTAAPQKKGRGEYELSGDFDAPDRVVRAADMLQRELVLRLRSYGYRRTANVVKPESGKKRLRLADKRVNIHLARQVQAALLFPKSRRDENGMVGGRPTIMRERYIVRRMDIIGLKFRGDKRALIRLGDLHLYNGSQTDTVRFSHRMKEVERLHRNSDRFPDAIKSLLDEHRHMLTAREPMGKRGEEIVELLMQHVSENAPDYNVDYVAGGDVVPTLLEMIDIPPMEEPVDIESIDPQDVTLRLREAARWRRFVAVRGPESARFRRAVREAYDSTCIVCGIKLPLSNHCRVPGVDSAHILPWATYDCDVVANGLCLCKLHHWAFDQQLIAITHEGGKYFVKVTEAAASALDPEAVSLLKVHEGEIPPARLPRRSSDRPRPAFLGKLYDLLGEAS